MSAGRARATLPEPLLASSVNGGGVFLLSHHGVVLLSEIDTTAIAPLPDGYLWARQCEGPAELRRVRKDSAEPVVLTAEHLDLHDVMPHEDVLYAVATATNTILELDAETFAERDRWTFPGEHDSQHLNSVCVHAGRLLASRFGTWRSHRGYKGRTRGAGQVFDVKTGEVLVEGLSQPHSLRSGDGLLWLCDSEAHRLLAYRDFTPVREVQLGGYARGLAFGEQHVYVGLSRSRNDAADGVARAHVVALERESMREAGRWALPANEIYDLVPATTARDSLLQSALAEAFGETGRVRHQRNRAAAETAVAAERAAMLQTRVDALDASLSQARADLAGEARSMEELTIWSRLQAAEVEALRRRLEGQVPAIERSAAEMSRAAAVLSAAASDMARLRRAVDDRDRHIAAIEGSRVWRWTRWMRRQAVPLPALGTPQDDVREAATGARLEREVEALAQLAALAQVPAADRAAVPVLGLAFAEPEAPVVSVVVVARGVLEDVRTCLEWVQASGDSVPFEMLVVCATADDGEMRRLATVPGLRLVVGEPGIGFAEAANLALDLVRGRRLAFLDGDTRVRPGWLDALSNTFDLMPGCGLAGSTLLAADGTLLEAGSVVWSDGSREATGRGGDPGAPEHRAVREVDCVSPVSTMVDAATFRAVGGFDGRYPDGHHGGMDLAFRIRAHGLRVFVQPASEVVWLGDGFPDVGAAIHGACEPGRDLFLDRWGETVRREQFRPGEHPAMARERGQLRRNVLVVDRYPPETDRDAGSRAIWQMLRVLQLHGANVRFWSVERGREGYAEALRAHGIATAGSGEDGFAPWIATNGCYLDAVILSRPMVAQAFIGDVRRHSAARRIYYGHDIHYARILGQHRLSGDPVLRAQADHVRGIERRLWRESDVVLYPTDEETEEVGAWLRSEGSGAVAATIPLFAFESVPDPGAVAGPGAREELLFVGGFMHVPNADGAVWFVREVWPRLRALHPDARLRLVGGDPTPEVEALASADVVVTGHVSEEALLRHYAHARVVVAPLRFGSGLKGKLLEAMRHGVPCITTSTGAQGLGDAGFIAVADDAASMAAAVSRLMTDDEAWTRSVREGLAYVAARFSVDAMWTVLSPALGTQGYDSVAARKAAIEAAGSPP